MRRTPALLSATLFALALGALEPAVAAPAHRCDLGTIAKMEQVAERDQRDLESARSAIGAANYWESAADELRECANDPSPPAPRYKLRIAAINDLDRMARVSLAAQLPGLNGGYVRLRHVLVILVLADANTPASVRAPVQREYDDVCIGGTPVYLRSQARVRCKIVVQNMPVIEATFGQPAPTSRPRPAAAAPKNISTQQVEPSKASPMVPLRRTCDTDPKTLTTVAPVTPSEARQKGITGDVSVVITLDSSGSVVDASAVSGPEILRSAAIDAARGGTYSSGTVDCKPTGGKFIFVVTFENE